MPNEIDLDVDQDIIRQAYVRVFQALRVGSAGTLRNPVRATTRGGVTFACRWLGMDAQPHDEVPIDDLPIILPRGGGYGIHFDPDPGDPVVVLALDGPPSQFYASGQVVTPQFPQHNDYACAVMFPGGRISSPETPTQPPNAAGEMLVGAEDGTATLLLRRRGSPTPLELGTVIIAAEGFTASVLIGSTTSAIPVACATQLEANLNTLNVAVQSIPPTGVPATDAAITAMKTAFSTAFNLFVDIADAKVRVDGPA